MRQNKLLTIAMALASAVAGCAASSVARKSSAPHHEGLEYGADIMAPTEKPKDGKFITVVGPGCAVILSDYDTGQIWQVGDDTAYIPVGKDRFRVLAMVPDDPPYEDRNSIAYLYNSTEQGRVLPNPLQVRSGCRALRAAVCNDDRADGFTDLAIGHMFRFKCKRNSGQHASAEASE